MPKKEQSEDCSNFFVFYGSIPGLVSIGKCKG